MVFQTVYKINAIICMRIVHLKIVKNTQKDIPIKELILYININVNDECSTESWSISINQSINYFIVRLKVDQLPT